MLPALRVGASMLDELKAEAKALDVPLATYHRRLLEARATGTTELQPRANPPARSVPVLRTTRQGPRQCDCPRPRPKATGYGLCTGCGGRR